MSTTSVAVVYAVMLEFGLNVTRYGNTVLAACFINDLLTVLALGFIFSPFIWKAGAFASHDREGVMIRKTHVEFAGGTRYSSAG